MAKYLAYRCGKRNHDFVLKTEEYETLFEMNQVKFRLFGAYDFEFVNPKTNEKVLHKVGKTVTKRLGAGGPSVVTDSYFNLDGVRVYEVLLRKGYRLKTTKIHLVNPEISLLDRSNKPVVTYKLNVKGPKQANVSGIGNSQSNTEITTDIDDFELITLGAFILSRIDYSTRIM